MKTRQRSWWIPWTFVAFFAVVIAVNAGLVVAAYSSWSGLETPDAYRRGLAYNKALEAEAAQQRRGWRATIRFVPTSKGRGRIEVALRDRQGAALNNLDIKLRFVRPTNAGHDFASRLTKLSEGRYAGEVAFPLPGQWRIELLAKRGAALHRTNKTIEVK